MTAAGRAGTAGYWNNSTAFCRSGILLPVRPESRTGLAAGGELYHCRLYPELGESVIANEVHGPSTHLRPVLLGGALGMAALFALFWGQETRFQDVGLGRMTADGARPHTQGHVQCQDVNNGQSCLNDARRRNLPRRALWLGASQLYGINRMTAADRTAPYLVFDTLKNEGWDVVTFAQPNGNPVEHYILFEYLRERLPIHGLIVAAVYDDMREQGVRTGIARAFKDGAVWARLVQSAVAQPLLGVDQTAPGPAAQLRPPERSLTAQDWSERWISETLESCRRMERLRREVRGQAFLALGDTRRYLETLRGRHTRNLAQYQVPIPPGPYRDNRGALEAMLSQARDQSIPTLLYIAPRPRDFFPYDPAAYAAYKRDLADLAHRHGVAMVDLEDIVPDDLWGEVDLTFGFPVRDPFHFRGAGHRLLAEAVVAAARRHLVDAAPE